MKNIINLNRLCILEKIISVGKDIALISMGLQSLQGLLGITLYKV